jgi:hypothetical protein
MYDRQFSFEGFQSCGFVFKKLDFPIVKAFQNTSVRLQHRKQHDKSHPTTRWLTTRRFWHCGQNISDEVFSIPDELPVLLAPSDS